MRQNSKNSLRWFFVATLAVVMGASLFFLPERKTYKRVSGVVWNTVYNITYCSNVNYADSIIAILNKVDNSASMFNKKSVVSAVNANDKNVMLDDYFKILFGRSIDINKETGGVFDPTVAPLMKLWRVSDDDGSLPSEETVDSVMSFIGMDKIAFDGDKVIKSDSRVQLDFSAIAKGFGCDEIGRMFDRNGVSNYIVEIGGEVAVKGVNDAGKPWKVSIDMPVVSNDTVIHSSADVLSLTHGGVATSGNYRNFKVVDGVKVAHIINPVTGYSEFSNLLSATVIADCCMDADAYATAFMVMGLEKTKQFVLSHGNIDVLLIYVDGDGKMQLWKSPNYGLSDDGQ